MNDVAAREIWSMADRIQITSMRVVGWQAPRALVREGARLHSLRPRSRMNDHAEISGYGYEFLPRPPGRAHRRLLRRLHVQYDTRSTTGRKIIVYDLR